MKVHVILKDSFVEKPVEDVEKGVAQLVERVGMAVTPQTFSRRLHRYGMFAADVSDEQFNLLKAQPEVESVEADGEQRAI